MLFDDSLPIGEDIPVKVTCSESIDHKLWISFFPIEQEEDLIHIIRDTNLSYLDDSISYSRGLVCAALSYDSDTTYIRVGIDRARGKRRYRAGDDVDEVIVRSLDFGWDQCVKKSFLRGLPDQLSEIPPLAYGARVVNSKFDPYDRHLQSKDMIDSEEKWLRVLDYCERSEVYLVYVHPEQPDVV